MNDHLFGGLLCGVVLGAFVSSLLWYVAMRVEREITRVRIRNEIREFARWLGVQVRFSDEEHPDDRNPG